MKEKKERIMLILSVVVIFSFSISTVFSIYSLNTLIAANSKEKSIVQANDITSSINAIFSEPLAVAMGIDNHFIHNYVKNIDSYSEKELADIFEDYLSHTIKYFDYDTAFIAPLSNLHYYTEYGYSKTINYDNPDDDWYEAFMNSDHKYELNVDNDQANENRTTIYINIKMEDKGKPIGACGVGLTMDDISKEVTRFESMDGYNVKLISKNGKIQVSNDSDYKTEILSKDSNHLFKYASDEIQKAIDNYDNSKNYNYHQHSKDSFYIIKYIDLCQWYLIIEYKGNSLPDAYGLLLKNVIACLASLLVLLVLSNLIINRVNKKINEFRMRSEIDKLTGLLNRHAYEEHKYELFHKSLAKITVAVLDINSLKKVNDTIGHKAGDELIKGGAAIINDFFKEYGSVYRIGGDEFTVIMDRPFENPDEKITAFKNKLKEWKGEFVDSINISVGVAAGALHEYLSLDELIEMADKLMYEDKSEYYRQNNIDRRKN